MYVLAINPGSTSTKISVFEDGEEVRKNIIRYDRDALKDKKTALEQVEMRGNDIEREIEKWGIKPDGVVGRGGLFKPLESGTYRINERLLKDIMNGKVRGEHISNIGAVLAHNIAGKFGVPSYFVDPVSVDEFEELARFSGIPEIERIALQHTLNIKACIRRVARDKKRKMGDLNLVVAHLGGGMSVCPVKKGRLIDANNAIQEGPFSPERSGTLPISAFLEMCTSGKYTKSFLSRRLVGEGGLVAYLGTNSADEVVLRIKEGDDYARKVYEAMAYQISKEIGAMATVLKGEVEYIVLTGGVANSRLLTDWVKARVEFIAPVLIYPGENEMLALAQGALRVLRGEEEAKEYR
ncbi:butyrate kinase [candidate division WOR-3 bacterium JGI_Cruoil_03_44_89]|uniref:Probable butyrate kinase n=1 Tax=candidate division WOR-3 bacterium JGI_Cruoil_03_44_89 TaxID=1973748 RepID=A0A235BZ44_UNCW3|nr:MAG: butyrate kinase [candidate division WOR-3 bacterium JGI_Cruoil_03_44_89]